MADIHVLSDSQGIVNGISGITAPSFPNPANGNIVGTLVDSSFSNWGASRAKTQKIYNPAVGSYFVAMPAGQYEAQLFAFSNLADLLANGGKVPTYDGDNKVLPGGTFVDITEARNAYAQFGGGIIDSNGNYLTA